MIMLSTPGVVMRWWEVGPTVLWSDEGEWPCDEG